MPRDPVDRVGAAVPRLEPVDRVGVARVGALDRVGVARVGVLDRVGAARVGVLDRVGTARVGVFDRAGAAREPPVVDRVVVGAERLGGLALRVVAGVDREERGVERALGVDRVDPLDGRAREVLGALRVVGAARVAGAERVGGAERVDGADRVVAGAERPALGRDRVDATGGVAPPRTASEGRVRTVDGRADPEVDRKSVV